MASGTGNLPNQSMSFSPFAILTAEEMNDLVENIESLADGTGIGDEAVGTSALADGAVTSAKLDDAAVTSTKLAPSKTVDSNGWTIYDYGTWKECYKEVTMGSTATATQELRGQNVPGGYPTGTTNTDYSFASVVGTGTGGNAVYASYNIQLVSGNIVIHFANLSSTTRTFAVSLIVKLIT